MSLSDERLAEIRKRDAGITPARYVGGMYWAAQDRRNLLAAYDELRAENEELRGEVSALTIELSLAHQELRQGWPKMARNANRTAIEQWNRADAAEAEVKRLRAQVAAVEGGDHAG